MMKMSRHRRVLLLTPYTRPHVGGISTFVHNLQASLETDSEWDCSVLARTQVRGDQLGEAQSGVPWFVLRTMLKILEERPDVVHGHAHWYTIAAAGLLQRLGIRPRLVFSFHTMPPGDRVARFRLIFERLLAKCDRVTFVSRSLEEQIRRLVRITAPSSILPPGVPIPPEPGNNPHIRTIGFAGPLVWGNKARGADILLTAMSELRKDVPDVRLVIAGSGPRQGDLIRRASELGISEAVAFLGSIDDMSTFWRSVGLYAHVSLQEGLPLSLLEAMSWGKPVLATNVGGIPEVVHDGRNGLLVPPEPGSVADGLKRLVKDPIFAQQLGQSARRTIKEAFGLEHLARTAREVYDGPPAHEDPRGHRGG